MDGVQPRKAGTAVERKNAIHGRPAESTLLARSAALRLFLLAAEFTLLDFQAFWGHFNI